MNPENQEPQEVTGAGELIRCRRCGIDKPRSEYRQVANPSICLECYAAKRRENRSMVAITELEPQDCQQKERASVYLTPQARAVLRVLALKHQSDSAAVEYLLMQVFETMAPQERAIVSYVLQQV
ncbi:hypothetical protein Alches_25670 [Alicyclobacillus hesperidum subsp. aegles]|nr:hypothetical protein Alches_25670 [Alicyclobacillus hesperidum subsp. aegles]